VPISEDVELTSSTCDNPSLFTGGSTTEPDGTFYDIFFVCSQICCNGQACQNQLSQTIYAYSAQINIGGHNIQDSCAGLDSITP